MFDLKSFWWELCGVIEVLQIGGIDQKATSIWLYVCFPIFRFWCMDMIFDPRFRFSCKNLIKNCIRAILKSVINNLNKADKYCSFQYVVEFLLSWLNWLSKFKSQDLIELWSPILASDICYLKSWSHGKRSESYSLIHSMFIFSPFLKHNFENWYIVLHVSKNYK